MSVLLEPSKVFYFASVLYRDDLYSIDDIYKIVCDRLGETYLSLTPTINPLTNYYSKEMGPEESLKRVMIVSTKLASRDEFVDHKLWADQLERDTSQSDQRRLNIDIGQLSLENLLLATGKNYSHRIYLNSGVYADLTLEFKQGKFTKLEWTYPDYTDSEKLEFFTHCRSVLLEKIA